MNLDLSQFGPLLTSLLQPLLVAAATALAGYLVKFVSDKLKLIKVELTEAQLDALRKAAADAILRVEEKIAAMIKTNAASSGTLQPTGVAVSPVGPGIKMAMAVEELKKSHPEITDSAARDVINSVLPTVGVGAAADQAAEKKVQMEAAAR